MEGTICRRTGAKYSDALLNVRLCASNPKPIDRENCEDDRDNLLRGEVVIEVSKAGQTRRRTGLLRGVLLRHSVHSWIDNFLAPRKLGCVAHIEQLESLVSEKSLKRLMLQGVR
jgi:hypothetical protein